MNNISIALIIPYFGNWPLWFNIYLETCKANPTIDFLFFTDCKSPIVKETNIKFVEFDLNQFNALASKKLDLDVTVSDAYKICDFRPAFGVIFEDYLSGYSFWGHSDIDIVLGNIRNFIRPDILEGNDVITSKKEYLTGHFTLYRNSDKVNNLYLQSKDYKKVFQSSQSFCFDECNFLWAPLLSGLQISNLRSNIDSMTHVIKRLTLDGHIKSYFESLIIEQDNFTAEGISEIWDTVISWKNGRLINLSDSKEYLYFHFHFLKKSEKFFIPACIQIPHSYYITKSGFSISNN